jgi:hypothetical protein
MTPLPVPVPVPVSRTLSLEDIKDKTQPSVSSSTESIPDEHEHEHEHEHERKHEPNQNPNPNPNQNQHIQSNPPTKIQINSLSTWKLNFHPVNGMMRNGFGEKVGWVVVDVRYVMADNEYDNDDGDDDGNVWEGTNMGFKKGGMKKVWNSTTSSTTTTTTTTRKPINLPNVWKMTILGSEFVESTDGRAKALAEVIESCGKVDGFREVGKGVLEVEW